MADIKGCVLCGGEREDTGYELCLSCFHRARGKGAKRVPPELYEDFLAGNYEVKKTKKGSPHYQDDGVYFYELKRKSAVNATDEDKEFTIRWNYKDGRYKIEFLYYEIVSREYYETRKDCLDNGKIPHDISYRMLNGKQKRPYRDKYWAEKA